MAINVHEEMFARAFVAPPKRERYLALLSSAKGRKKVLNSLHHIHDLDARYAVRVLSSDQTVEGVLEALLGKGAPELCYVISDDPDVDQREMSLKDAIETVHGSNFGTVVSCIPGKLAYVETEDATFRYILAR
jgi:hypothetical protein